MSLSILLRHGKNFVYFQLTQSVIQKCLSASNTRKFVYCFSCLLTLAEHASFPFVCVFMLHIIQCIVCKIDLLVIYVELL